MQQTTCGYMQSVSSTPVVAGHAFYSVGLAPCNHATASAPLGSKIIVPFSVYDDGSPPLEAAVSRTLLIASPCADGLYSKPLVASGFLLTHCVCFCNFMDTYIYTTGNTHAVYLMTVQHRFVCAICSILDGPCHCLIKYVKAGSSCSLAGEHRRAWRGLAQRFMPSCFHVSRQCQKDSVHQAQCCRGVLLQRQLLPGQLCNCCTVGSCCCPFHSPVHRGRGNRHIISCSGAGVWPSCGFQLAAMPIPG